MKCNQSRPVFELVSPCPFPKTITITPRAPPHSYLYIINLFVLKCNLVKILHLLLLNLYVLSFYTYSGLLYRFFGPCIRWSLLKFLIYYSASFREYIAKGLSFCNHGRRLLLFVFCFNYLLPFFFTFFWCRNRCWTHETLVVIFQRCTY